MEKMATLRSLYRAASFLRSSRYVAITHHQLLLRSYSPSRFLSSFPSSPSAASPLQRHPSDFRSPFALGIGSRRFFSEDVAHLPSINDSDVRKAFKDLMAMSWEEIPYSAACNVEKALSKSSDDKAGQEILTNVFRAAEACEEFGGMLISLKMELDDAIGVSGENVKPLSDEFIDALRTAYQRYAAYLDAFGPDEAYLRKKVETELGAKMIYLKMRCAGLGPEWGKVTVLGTSGLAGSYVEQRA